MIHKVIEKVKHKKNKKYKKIYFFGAKMYPLIIELIMLIIVPTTNWKPNITTNTIMPPTVPIIPDIIAFDELVSIAPPIPNNIFIGINTRYDNTTATIPCAPPKIK